MLELLGNTLTGVLFVGTAMGLVALSAYVAITPTLHPAALIRGWLARQTARHAIADFDREWARYNTNHHPDSAT